MQGWRDYFSHVFNYFDVPGNSLMIYTSIKTIVKEEEFFDNMDDKLVLAIAFILFGFRGLSYLRINKRFSVLIYLLVQVAISLIDFIVILVSQIVIMAISNSILDINANSLLDL